MTESHAPARRRQHRPRLLTVSNLGALLVALFTAAPLYWLVVSSFRGPLEIGAAPTPLPRDPTTANYTDAFAEYEFGTYLANSAIVSVASTALVLCLGTLAAYALARLPLRGTTPVMTALLMISLFPTIALAAPLYLLMRDIGWLNSHQGLILAYTAFNLPFAVWILRNYFLSIPREMEEVAWMDGASPIRTVVSVILPQARPGLFTAGVFTFVACWTEFLLALTLNTSDQYRTIAVGIALFGSQYTVPYGTVFAAATAAMLPIALLVLVFRRAVVSGLTSGAVKG
ncbi:carbohydrate ABC transporter permease [Allostreptomyces psammosilenae]|uniref:Multiple sugar transport system permease protein n=1 Tax=Allostreptomyces psammosilenae TaxID=1892865 RepID=A0A852ZSC1_9ACTN|nr:carbohydrate ABC transporter permease [Allostreptomyces psammosilenae]NYI03734.1 multiple sugar transport system permease protein [Allostreptomyces psammosilenae]